MSEIQVLNKLFLPRRVCRLVKAAFPQYHFWMSIQGDPIPNLEESRAKFRGSLKKIPIEQERTKEDPNTGELGKVKLVKRS